MPLLSHRCSFAVLVLLLYLVVPFTSASANPDPVVLQQLDDQAERMAEMKDTLGKIDGRLTNIEKQLTDVTVASATQNTNTNWLLAIGTAILGAAITFGGWVVTKLTSHGQVLGEIQGFLHQQMSSSASARARGGQSAAARSDY